MAEGSDDQSLQKPHFFQQLNAAAEEVIATEEALAAEEAWIRSFLEFYGTDNVTRFFRADLVGVSLTGAIEAVVLGEMIATEKCEGPGTICTFEYDSEEGQVVRVEVFFVAGEMTLEFRKAYVVEVKGEPNAA